MNRYTIKQSKITKVWGDILSFIYVLIRWSFRVSFRFSKILHRLSNRVKKRANIAHQKSGGVTYSIISAVLLDSRIIRFRIQALNGKKYHVYHMGEYKDKYKEEGKDVTIEDQHYFLTASLYDEWKEI